MSVPGMVVAYVVIVLGSLSAAGIYEEYRRRRFEPGPSEDRIFRCQQCGYVYTDEPDVDMSRCSQCGRVNAAIEF